MLNSFSGKVFRFKYLHHVTNNRYIAILASFVNFLLPPRGFGEGWGGVKLLRFLQGLLYQILNQRTATINPHFSACDKAGRIGY